LFSLPFPFMLLSAVSLSLCQIVAAQSAISWGLGSLGARIPVMFPAGSMFLSYSF
jgi:hypothetical protein